MIKLNHFALHNAQNKPFLRSKAPISFEDNTLYFIIGRSGVGKTSLIDFITSPFTEEPIKNGEIEFSSDIAPVRLWKDTLMTSIKIKNSFSFFYRAYYRFIRKSIAFIPQKTDSFHPAVPVSRQMFRNYKAALPAGEKGMWRKFVDLIAGEKDRWKNFADTLEKCSSCAGWESISIDLKNKDVLLVKDQKVYINDETGNPFIDEGNEPNRKEEKYFANDFSTGQQQRLLILNALLQFKAAENPVLIGDEFLVNFSYGEANEVFRKIIQFYSGSKEKKHKMGIFILHDLSFDALEQLPEDIKAQLILVEETKTDTADGSKLLGYHEVGLRDFMKSAWASDKEAVFSPFKESYKQVKIPDCELKITPSEEILLWVQIPESPHYCQGLYRDIDFKIGKNQFIVLTGFSGYGKSTLCRQIIEKYFSDDKEKTFKKKALRYMPSTILPSLSEDSQTTVYEDLSIMYEYYNGIKDINKFRDHIKEIFFIKLNIFTNNFKNVNDIPDEYLNKFLKRKIYDFSGGQQQRYWFGRILFDYFVQENKPEFLVFDESIASLDCITKNSIIKYLLRDIFCKYNLTVLFISHDFRDIGVIYETLAASLNDDIKKVFKHYIIIKHNLYQVDTAFPLYQDNEKNHKANKYTSLSKSSSETVYLRLNENGIHEGKTE